MARSPQREAAGFALTRAGLVEAVAGETGLTLAKAGNVVDATLGAIRTALQGGREVRLTGFGSFSVGRRKASTGRNPRTGDAIAIPASASVKFRPGRLLKVAVGTGSE